MLLHIICVSIFLVSGKPNLTGFKNLLGVNKLKKITSLVPRS